MNLHPVELQLLIRGCRRHQPYRGSAAPKGDCPSCRDIYRLRQTIENQWEADRVTVEPPLFDAHPMCQHCVLGEPHDLNAHMRSLSEARRGSR